MAIRQSGCAEDGRSVIRVPTLTGQGRPPFILVPLDAAVGLKMHWTPSCAIASTAGAPDTMEALPPVTYDLVNMHSTVEREGGHRQLQDNIDHGD